MTVDNAGYSTPLRLSDGGYFIVTPARPWEVEQIARLLNGKKVILMVKGSDGNFYHWKPGKEQYP